LEDFLLATDYYLTPNIITKIIEEFHKVNDNFNIMNILNLGNAGKIPVKFNQLRLNNNILSDLMGFMMEKTEHKLKEDFIMSLSNQNKNYAYSHYGGDDDSFKASPSCDDIDSNTNTNIVIDCNTNQEDNLDDYEIL